MKVKKFIAKNTSEAMTKIREELGNEAVILNTKPVETGGFLGFFTKKNVEIIAAIDPDYSRNKPPRNKRMSTPLHSPALLQQQQITGEIAELKKLMQGLQRGSAVIQRENYPGYLNNVYQLLLSQDVTEVNLQLVMDKLIKRWYSENGEEQPEKVIEEWVREECLHMLTSVSCGPFLYNKKFLNVVGPTGVGKTTTIAKIAAQAVLQHKKKVAFITTDTYRIAAIEQLKTYASILKVPVEVAYSIDDFKKAKEKFKDFDVVFVDSAGRNYKNPLYVKQLQEIIDFNSEMETHLVLSLGSKYQDMKQIIEQFQSIHIDRIIYTKADETISFGTMLNIAMEYNLGPSYITHGQNVPDDIKEATFEYMMDRIVRSSSNHE